MNLQNYVDVTGLKAKIGALNKQHDDAISTLVDDKGRPDVTPKAFPPNHPARRLPHESIRVMVNEAVNLASKDIIAAAKDEVFELVHKD